MYIACPNCSTDFVVSAEQIGSTGRKVKCSKCHHLWHQQLPKAKQTEQQTNTPPTPPSLITQVAPGRVNLPALRPVNIPPPLHFNLLFLISLIFILSIMLFQESLGIKSIGNSSKLIIRNLQVESQEELKKMIITYQITNPSSTQIIIPLIQIRLLDENSKIIASHIAEKNIKLSPGRSVRLKTEFISPAASRQVDITLGNKLDFILR